MFSRYSTSDHWLQIFHDNYVLYSTHLERHLPIQLLREDSPSSAQPAYLLRMRHLLLMRSPKHVFRSPLRPQFPPEKAYIPYIYKKGNGTFSVGLEEFQGEPAQSPGRDYGSRAGVAHTQSIAPTPLSLPLSIHMPLQCDNVSES